MARLNRIQFIKTINAIQEFFEYEDAFEDFIGKFGGSSPCAPDVVGRLIDALNVMYDLELTDEYGSDIDYFVYHLAFGKNPHDLKITENGNEIRLSSAGDLYDYITGGKE